MKKKEQIIIIGVLVVVLAVMLLVTSNAVPKLFKSKEKQSEKQEETTTHPQLDEIEDAQRSRELMAEKRLQMRELMTEVSGYEYTLGNCRVTLEELYYDADTDEGCFHFTIKTTDDTVIDENFYEDDIFGGLRFGEKIEVEEEVIYRYSLEAYGVNNIDYEINDNILHGYAFMEGWEYDDADVKEKSLMWLFDAEEYIKNPEEWNPIEVLVTTDARDNRCFEITSLTNIYISRMSLVIKDRCAVRNLSIVFNDGSEIDIVIEKKTDFYWLVDSESDGNDVREFTFNRLVNIEDIDYIKLNGKEYY